jgi:hypothetical protein
MTASSCFPAAMNGSDYERGVVVRHAFQLERIAVAWMTIEAAGAFASRVAAGGVGLLLFGLASLVELLSAVFLIWPLSIEPRRALRVSETAEWSASPIDAPSLPLSENVSISGKAVR